MRKVMKTCVSPTEELGLLFVCVANKKALARKLGPIIFSYFKGY